MSWVLITVTACGEVHESKHSSKYLADQAASLARYGMTPEEMTALQAQIDEWEAQRQKAATKRAEAWRAANPPRKPKWGEEGRLRKTGQYSSYEPYSTIGQDGLVYDWPGDPADNMRSSNAYSSQRGEWCDWVLCRHVIRGPHDVKEVRVYEVTP